MKKQKIILLVLIVILGLVIVPFGNLLAAPIYTGSSTIVSDFPAYIFGGTLDVEVWLPNDPLRPLFGTVDVDPSQLFYSYLFTPVSTPVPNAADVHHLFLSGVSASSHGHISGVVPYQYLPGSTYEFDYNDPTDPASGISASEFTQVYLTSIYLPLLPDDLFYTMFTRASIGDGVNPGGQPQTLTGEVFGVLLPSTLGGTFDPIIYQAPEPGTLLLLGSALLLIGVTRGRKIPM